MGGRRRVGVGQRLREVVGPYTFALAACLDRPLRVARWPRVACFRFSCRRSRWGHGAMELSMAQLFARVLRARPLQLCFSQFARVAVLDSSHGIYSLVVCWLLSASCLLMIQDPSLYRTRRGHR